MGAKKKKAEGDPAKGEKLFKNLCAVCHAMAAHGTGPLLKGAHGGLPAQKEGFSYSAALKGLGDKKWTDGNLDKYLKSPADYAPGNAMAFAGIPNAKDRGDVIAYLKKNA
jgi:cytochrome c